MRKFINLSLLVCICNTGLSQKTRLCLHLTSGNEYTQQINSIASITQYVNGQDISIIMGLDSKITYKVTAVTNGCYDMDVYYTALKMVMKMQQMSIEFSSEKTEDTDPLSNVLAKMIGKPFQVKMTSAGKLLDVQNAENIITTIIDNYKDLPEAKKEQIKAQLIEAYGNESFKGNIEMVMAVFPGKNKVNIGDKWNVNTNLKSGFAANVLSEYEFCESGTNYALIKGNSKIVSSNKDAYITSNEIPMRYDINGEMTSDIKIEKDTGWIIEATFKQYITGNSFIKTNPQTTDEMKVPVSMKNQLKIIQ